MCEFRDAEGRLHTIIDKIPVFTGKLLTQASLYPQAGSVRCEVLNNVQDSADHTLTRITIARPDHIESTVGVSEFVVLDSQVLNEADCMR